MTPITKKIIISITLIILLIIAVFIYHSKVATPAVALATPVQVAHPTQQSLPLTETTTGYLVASESTNITPLASGYIRAIAFHEGQTIQQGQTLFQLDDDTQKNALASAEATAQLSQLQYERDQKLLQRGFVTQDLCYTAKVTNQQNQAALQTAKTNFSQRTITAPFSGTIGAIAVSIGDYVNPGNALTMLVDNEHLRASYTLPAKHLNNIQLNQAVDIQGSTNSNKINARVSYVAPTIDQSTQTIAVHASIDNAKNLFKPGEYVSITQSLGTNNNSLLLPEQSVLASIDGYSVFIDKNNHAIQTPITIGDRINGNVIVKSGLSEKDLVVIAGQNELKNNQVIQVITEMR